MQTLLGKKCVRGILMLMLLGPSVWAVSWSSHIPSSWQGLMSPLYSTSRNSEGFLFIADIIMCHFD